MKRLRMGLLVFLALTMPACGVWQCGVGREVTNSVVIENNGLVLIAIITVFGCLALAALAMGGLGGGE